MNSLTTSRFALPLLAAGQADKELTHNEALTRIDMLLHPVVQAVGLSVPPTTPGVGQCWVVGVNPTGAWAGQANRLAGWSEGGWRFVDPREALVVWDISQAIPVAYRGGLWQESDVRGARLTVGGRQVVGSRKGAIADPQGGGTIDDVARSTLVAILAALRGHGLIGTS
ncbi:DUF2793 domain-containing protein [Sphingomonas melonis]